MPKDIALIGLQGSGKTTLGQKLALQLNRRFIDTDYLIEQQQEVVSCRLLYQTMGESFFRAAESQAVASLSDLIEPLLIATGGGTLLNPQNGQALKAHSRLIYLHLPVELARERLKGQPAYTDLDNFTQFYQTRSAVYTEWADLTVCVAGLSLEQAAAALKERIDGF